MSFLLDGENAIWVPRFWTSSHPRSSTGHDNDDDDDAVGEVIAPAVPNYPPPHDADARPGGDEAGQEVLVMDSVWSFFPQRHQEGAAAAATEMEDASAISLSTLPESFDPPSSLVLHLQLPVISHHDDHQEQQHERQNEEEDETLSMSDGDITIVSSASPSSFHGLTWPRMALPARNQVEEDDVDDDTRSTLNPDFSLVSGRQHDHTLSSMSTHSSIYLAQSVSCSNEVRTPSSPLSFSPPSSGCDSLSMTSIELPPVGPSPQPEAHLVSRRSTGSLASSGVATAEVYGSWGRHLLEQNVLGPEMAALQAVDRCAPWFAGLRHEQDWEEFQAQAWQLLVVALEGETCRENPDVILARWIQQEEELFWQDRRQRRATGSLLALPHRSRQQPWKEMAWLGVVATAAAASIGVILLSKK